MSIAMIKGMAKNHMKGNRLLLTAAFVLLLTTWAVAAQFLTGILQLPSLFDFIEAILDGGLGLNAVTVLFPVLLVLLFILADMLHMSYRWFGIDIINENQKPVEWKEAFQGFRKKM
ncbi:MAG: hypothetical protein U5K84_10405 [Alkalibacterium sp.]|nr:hypothetical protein [Alkalibacterium sp.]